LRLVAVRILGPLALSPWSKIREIHHKDSEEADKQSVLPTVFLASLCAFVGAFPAGCNTGLPFHKGKSLFIPKKRCFVADTLVHPIALDHRAVFVSDLVFLTQSGAQRAQRKPFLRYGDRR
jgi:hypothetical protein